MKLLEKIVITVGLTIAITVGYGTALYVSAQDEKQQYSNPAWAPLYVPGVRYYYFPDIEMYYDLSNQDFVYLENDEWLFSSTLPPIHSGYDLYNGFAVALKASVFEPWTRNDYYLSHYPRYYYRDKYSEEDQSRIRGFDENSKEPFYREPEEDRNWENETQNDDKTEQKRELHNSRPASTIPQATRPVQLADYFGKDIDLPAKVQARTRENAPRADTATRAEKIK